ncbi:hypothetical protein HDU98_012067 [Podochytrium sp. JEL0797]|nr:hypothetical protein HDU98_012067 [Podochytrium sp. JEL0797]
MRSVAVAAEPQASCSPMHKDTKVSDLTTTAENASASAIGIEQLSSRDSEMGVPQPLKLGKGSKKRIGLSMGASGKSKKSK